MLNTALLATFAVVAAAPAPKPLLYGSDRTQPPFAAAPARVTAYAKGDRVFIATDGANLRREGAVTAAVVAPLKLGTQVEVVARGPLTRVIDRDDTWYEVVVKDGADAGKTGFVFGNVVTPFLVQRDLDGDGKDEIAALAFTSQFQPRLRVLDGAKKSGTWLDMDGAVDDVPGGEAFLVDAGDPKQIGVVVCGLESKRCDTWILAYGGKKLAVVAHAEGTSRTPKIERPDAGHVVVDGKRFEKVGGVFVPRISAPTRGAHVKRTAPREVASVHFDPEPRGWPEENPCYDGGVVDEGKYAGWHVLTCPLAGGGKASPDIMDDNRFLMKGKNLVSFAARDGDVEAKLRSDHGFHVTHAPPEVLEGDEPQTLFSGAAGDIVLTRRSQQKWTSGLKPAFVHDVAGVVYRDDDNGTYVVRTYDDYLVRYEWKPRALPPGHALFVGDPCHFVGSDPEMAHVAEAPPAKATLVAFNASGAAWKEDGEEGAVYVKDALGRLLRLDHEPDAPGSCGAEPMVYAHAPVPTAVVYRPRVDVDNAIPPLEHDGAWRFTAGPGGISSGGGAAAESALFWLAPARGGVAARGCVRVDAASARGWLAARAHRAGIEGAAFAELVNAVGLEIERRGGVCARVLSRDEVEALFPVDVTPAPARFVRFYVAFSDGAAAGDRAGGDADGEGEGRDADANGASGLDVVEWGYVDGGGAPGPAR